MFKNIGKKIMVLTTVLCIIGMVLSLLAGFSIFYILGERTNNVAIAVSSGVAVALLYALICWIGSFAAYGYGKLIDNTDRIVKAFEQMAKNGEEKPTAEAKDTEIKDTEIKEPTTWSCEKCGATVSTDLDECPICKIMDKPENKE
ncbi:MAG: HPP family protein [Clostridia bacterium]|nr:HPP family protein [Clostridia bacterium]